VVEITNNIKSEEPRTIIGISTIIFPYVIHREDEITFIMQNIKEYIFVDFFVYNIYINTNRVTIERDVAENAMINSPFMFIILST
jgi:hypothetical protein